MRTHVDHALQPELGADRGRGHTVLACAGFRDDAFLAHAAGKDDLAQHVVDLVRTGMVQLVALEINLRASQPLGQPLGEIERTGPAHVMFPEIVHLGPEIRIGLGVLIALFQFQNERHQRLRHEAPAEIAEPALFVGAGHEGIEQVIGHGSRPSLGSDRPSAQRARGQGARTSIAVAGPRKSARVAP